jgi:microcompartment protein CcmL/EutN
MTPGKFVLLFTGQVAEVDESFQAGITAGGALVLDRLFLPHIAEPILEALAGQMKSASPTDATGLVETRSIASALRAADAALKCASVTLTHLALARGIGGKGWFTLAGVQHDVEAALEAASASVAPAMLVGAEIIPRPHEVLRALGLT